MRDLLCTTKYLYNYFLSQGFVYFIQLEYYSVDMFATSESTRYYKQSIKKERCEISLLIYQNIHLKTYSLKFDTMKITTILLLRNCVYIFLTSWAFIMALICLLFHWIRNSSKIVIIAVILKIPIHKELQLV